MCMRYYICLLFTACLIPHFAAAGDCLDGDIDNNCRVDLADLYIFADQWLDDGSCADPNCANVDGVGSVSMSDFLLIAKNWDTYRIPLVINEFMASNDSTVTDPQGEYDDWIEIYNNGPIPVDIGGMYLTDDLLEPDKWRVPIGYPDNTIISPGEYLVIWADKDLAYGPFHSDFKLDAGGEAIGLFESDGSSLIDSIVFGDQATDYSYGRFPNGQSTWFASSDPTPGSENSIAIAPNPVFSHSGGVFTETFLLQLYVDDMQAAIHYTLDGSEPTETSPVYSGPISVNLSTYIRARTYKAGMFPSSVVNAGYIALDSDVSDFNSNLPIVVIDTFGDVIAEDQQSLCYTTVIDTNDFNRATITESVDFSGIAGINLRGQTSTMFPKKQYHLEVWDESYNDKAASILGMPKESDWVLQSPYSDKTLMRNVLAYQWSNDIGQYAPRTRFVEMFLNNDGDSSISYGDDYVGVYVVIEKIKRDDGRVDIAKLDENDNAEPAITGGYIIKLDKLDDAQEETFASVIGDLGYVEPRIDEITPEQKDWIVNYITGDGMFEDALFGPDFADPVNGYAAYIDPNTFIDHHILVELMKNGDGYWASTYMYKDRGGKLKMGPVWDYNMALGNDKLWTSWEPEGWHYDHYWLNTVGGYGYASHFWYDRLFADPDFEARYIARYTQLRQNELATAGLLAKIDEIALLLNESQARNYQKWDSVLGYYIWRNPDGYEDRDTYQKEVDWMKSWLEARVNWMDSQLIPQP